MSQPPAPRASTSHENGKPNPAPSKQARAQSAAQSAHAKNSDAKRPGNNVSASVKDKMKVFEGENHRKPPGKGHKPEAPKGAGRNAEKPGPKNSKTPSPVRAANNPSPARGANKPSPSRGANKPSPARDAYALTPKGGAKAGLAPVANTPQGHNNQGEKRKETNAPIFGAHRPPLASFQKEKQNEEKLQNPPYVAKSGNQGYVNREPSQTPQNVDGAAVPVIKEPQNQNIDGTLFVRGKGKEGVAAQHGWKQQNLECLKPPSGKQPSGKQSETQEKRAHSAPDTSRPEPAGSNTIQVESSGQRTQSAQSSMQGSADVNLKEELKAKDERISECSANKEKVEKREKRISELTDSLATEMNAKVSADESNLENISVGVRPMTVSADYTNFCSSSWLDACTALEEEAQMEEEDERYMLLCHILMTCEQEANRMYKRAWTGFMANPFAVLGGQTNPTQRSARHKEEIGDDVMAVIKDSHRRQASDCDLSPLQEEIKRKVSRECPKVDLKHVEPYIKEAAMLAYKMVIQKPAMTFDLSHTRKPWDDHKSTLEAYFGSNIKKNGSMISYYVFPTMLHGDRIMVSGKVMVK